MNTSNTSQTIGSLDDLDKAAKEAAAQLNTATSHNAIWDKSAKALKTGLADLDKTRGDAKKEAEQADKLAKSLEGNYDSDVSDSVRKTREDVDKEIAGLWTKMDTAEKALAAARQAAIDAKQPLDKSTADFDKAQKDLLGLPKQIQDQQKQLSALENEVKDADAKHQPIEAVVKLEDLKMNLAKFNDLIKPETEAALWTKWNSAANDLIQKNDALLKAQGAVPDAEVAYKAAKADYDNADKNRLDKIKQKVADEEKSTQPGHYQTVAAS